MAAVAMLAVGCGSSAPSADDDAPVQEPAPSTQVADTPKAAPPADLTGYLDQQIDWQQCEERDDADCGSIEVPVDYAHPGAAAITMPLIRLRAIDQDHRIGALTTNPGGPGESGYDLVLAADDDPGLAKLLQRYDLVGWDPRGVGRTEGVRCLSDADMDAYLATDFSPTDDAGRARVADAQLAYARGCQANAGELLPFVGSEFVARDMDLLRSALGEEKLNYVGFSDGTLLGQLYAQQFPDRVGRMVLDSVEDPSGDGGSRTYQEDSDDDPDPGTPGDLEAADAQVDSILSGCAAQPQCPLGADPAGAQRRLDDLLARVRATPIPLPDGRVLGENLLLIGVFQATYDEDSWATLTDGIAEALAGDGTKIAGLADEYVGRGADGHYDHKQDAFWSVVCMKGDPAEFAPTPDPGLLARIGRAADRARATSPLFGENNTYSGSLCSFWQVPPSLDPQAIEVTGAPPILLVNNVGDVATDVDGARRVARSLRGSVLVENDRADHIAFGKGSDCVDDIVVRFLFDGVLPPAGTTCGRP